MQLRKALTTDIPIIWEILQQGIEQRRFDGSGQWQNGYPNEQIVSEDITNGIGYVITIDGEVVAYAVVLFGIEPVYNDIEGAWLTNGDYAVIHRMASADAIKGQGVATRFFGLIEDLCIRNKIYSIKVDTNFDNIPMLKILDKLNYTYCGTVYFNGSPRMAYEKVLESPLRTCS